ncbi:MAG: DUF433 domain-containing protein [Ignavibacterium sp.]
MKSLIERITINPEICNGKPTIRGLRITVSTILEYLSAGETVENILKAYPMLEEEDIKACLEFAKVVTDKSFITYQINAL